MKKPSKLKIILLTIIPILFLLILTILLIRLVSPREIDDVAPGISCQVELLEKADILWVIPIFQNNSIVNNSEWCTQIKSLGKEVQLHGVYHKYKEFKTPRSPEYLQEGIDAFQSCFNKYPSKFKPPQLAYAKSNDEIIKQAKLKRIGLFNQFLHKVYHCNDTGLFSNKFINYV